MNATRWSDTYDTAEFYHLDRELLHAAAKGTDVARLSVNGRWLTMVPESDQLAVLVSEIEAVTGQILPHGHTGPSVNAVLRCQPPP
eukprot:9485828-Pyramimonas_sp.AAC.1